MSESISADKGYQDRAALECKHPGLLMAAVIGVSVMQLLDVTIANVALPHMQSSLGATLDNITWVLTSFIIASVVATPVVGWLSDRVGSRTVFLWAVAGFLISSMLCGAATSLEEMVLFRIAQGISAAFVGPMSQTILLDTNPPSKHASAMSLWGAVVMVAPITGPMLGGFLTDTLNWRWVFYINLPLGIPTFIVLLWLLPSRAITDRRLDAVGALFLALALGTLQLILDRGQGLGWLGSKEIVLELVIMASAFWIFAVHTKTTQNALFPGELFKSSAFLGVFIFMFVLGVANVGIASILPTMYQTVWGYSAFDTGWLMMPRGIGVLISMTIVGRIMHKTDVRWLVSGGYMVAGFAMWQMSRWTLEMGQWPIVTSGFMQGLGLGFIFMPINVAAMSILKPEHRPDGSSLLNLMRNVGGSFGISVIVTMLSRNTQTSHADLAVHITDYTLPSIDIASMADRFAEYGSVIMYAIDAEINRQALMIAYIDNFYMMAFFILFVSLLPLFLKPVKLGPGGR
ncbi:DHA2 family efflux MFS transporter permease subunit [Halioxenophilus sp. WMMB6]|uniref:DHA2 family efflux MFS transporter permease subunit n=1 Tax=Halioxenophilus sp. WMMB6 TaxID=3073815 RepID=UPI00295E9C31|nr:DHA2 family efflux MFS transporter permease subunit [Halioxenophilus sp. WMMB6]